MGGLPRRYTKIKELRDEGVDPLLVDSGDFFFSTTKIDLANKQSEKFRAESILEGFRRPLDIIELGPESIIKGLREVPTILLMRWAFASGLMRFGVFRTRS